MTEHDRAVEREQALRRHPIGGGLRDAEQLGRAPEQRRVADRLGRRKEQKHSRLTR